MSEYRGNRAEQVRAIYNELRAAALINAAQRLNGRDPGHLIRLTEIDETALFAWRQWIRRDDRPGGWDWRAAHRSVRSHLNRFEVAIWSGYVLCGLAIGKASRGDSHLAIRLLEGNPAPAHPLKGKVAICALEAADRFARVLQKRQLRLIDPLPGALPTYQRLGFTVAPGNPRPPYCFVELTPS